MGPIGLIGLMCFVLDRRSERLRCKCSPREDLYETSERRVNSRTACPTSPPGVSDDGRSRDDEYENDLPHEGTESRKT